MTKETMIRRLKRVQEQYKNKLYATGETNIYLMLNDVIIFIERYNVTR